MICRSVLAAVTFRAPASHLRSGAGDEKTPAEPGDAAILGGRHKMAPAYDFAQEETGGDTVEEIRLHPTVDADRPDFMRLAEQTISPVYKRAIPDAVKRLVASYWDTSKVSRTIVTSDGGEFCGYCNLRFEQPGRSEVGIELLEGFRGRDPGPLALRMLIREQEGRHGADWYRAVVEGNNHRSAMMRKLGAEPDGLELAPFFADEEEASQAAERLASLVDDRLRLVAGWFGVEPSLLLTHRLLSRVSSSLD